jgi:hypothetical protein
MVETQAARRRITLLAMVLLSSQIPACSAPNGAPHPWLRPFLGDGNVVQRPTYEAPGEKRFYVSGYAGHQYGPVLQGRTIWRQPAGSATSIPAAPTVSVGHGTWEPE